MIGETNIILKGTRNIASGDIVIQKSQPPTSNYYVCDGSLQTSPAGYPFKGGEYELKRNSTATLGASVELNSVCNNGSIFVVVGNNGKIYTSNDGTMWTNQTSGTSANLNGVVYGNNKFVAVGNGGVVLISSNGTTWNQPTLPSTQNLNDIIYQDEVFVIVGANGTILTSFNGVGWTKKTSSTTNALNSITCGHGNFVAVGDGGIILLSSTGEVWESKSSGTTSNFSSVTYGLQRFWAVGGSIGSAYISVKGDIWSRFTMNDLYFSNICYYDGVLIGCASNGIFIRSTESTDYTWKSADSLLYKFNSMSVKYGQLVLVGSQGNFARYTIENHWIKSELNTDLFGYCSGATNDHDLAYVCTSTGYILSSPITRDFYDFYNEYHVTGEQFNCVHLCRGTTDNCVVVGGENGTIVYGYHANWTKKKLLFSDKSITNIIYDPRGDRRLYVTTENKVYYSTFPSLSTWTLYFTVPSGTITGIGVGVDVPYVTTSTGKIYYISGDSLVSISPTIDNIKSLSEAGAYWSIASFITTNGEIYSNSVNPTYQSDWLLVGKQEDYGLSSMDEITTPLPYQNSYLISGTSASTGNFCLVRINNEFDTYNIWDTGIERLASMGSNEAKNIVPTGKRLAIGTLGIGGQFYWNNENTYKLPNYYPTAYQTY